MTDSVLIILAPGWALGYDSLQWMLLRARKRQEETYWQPIAFVGSEKRILLRVLREKGVELTPKAAVYIDAMPDKFRDWYKLKSEQAACGPAAPAPAHTREPEPSRKRLSK